VIVKPIWEVYEAAVRGGFSCLPQGIEYRRILSPNPFTSNLLTYVQLQTFAIFARVILCGPVRSCSERLGRVWAEIPVFAENERRFLLPHYGPVNGVRKSRTMLVLAVLGIPPPLQSGDLPQFVNVGKQKN